MSTATSEQLDLTLRERLEGLMAFRVVIVTVLLGSAIAFDAEALSSLSDPKNVTLLSLIVGTYLLTIGYAAGLRNSANLEALARLQVLNDMVIAIVLVIVSGGLDSLFTFLFYLNIISAAIVVGRGGAFVLAGLTSIVLVTLALEASGAFSLAEVSVTRSGPEPSATWRTASRSTLLRRSSSRSYRAICPSDWGNSPASWSASSSIFRNSGRSTGIS